MPADLTPRWPDLPALAWALARAHMPGPRWWAAPAGVVSAVLFAAPYLVAVHAVGGLAALTNGRAHALVIPDARRRDVHAAGLIGFTASTTLTVAAVWGLTVVIHPLPALVPAEVLLTAAWAAPFIPTLAAGTQPTLARARGGERDPVARRRGRLSAAHPRPASGAVLVGYLAAWPQRTGAGTQLATRLCQLADQTQVTLRLDAGNPDVARLYERWGFSCDAPGAPGMTRHPRPASP